MIESPGITPGFLVGWRWCDVRMIRPTQKTCSTAGPLCIIHPNAIFWAEVPLSLPIPITQHTLGPAFVQWLVIHMGAVGERERVKEKNRR
jgi:hypothetical protein